MACTRCNGTGTIYVEGPCDAAPLEAPCPCLEKHALSKTQEGH